jgi:hypothetical protein
MTSTKLPPLYAGIYRHYKGPYYQVYGYAHDANDENRAVVVYQALELNGAHRGPRMAVRTVEDFLAYVHEDGSTCSVSLATCPEYPDAHTKRFEYQGPVW